MVFPGVLRGRPGPRLATIHTSRPRRSLSSPWMLPVHCSRPHPRPGAPIGARPKAEPINPNPGPSPNRPQSRTGAPINLIQGRAQSGPGATRAPHIRKRRGPGPLEEPFPSGPEALRFGWRGLTPQWPRSLRLGPASVSNLRSFTTECNPFARPSPHIPQKMSPTLCTPHPRASERAPSGTGPSGPRAFVPAWCTRPHTNR
jgi:hypothetical protein